MTDDRWARIDAVLEAAMARSPEERNAFVKDACKDDAALCDEVLSLLAHAGSADGVFEPSSSTARTPFEPGRQLGPYILGELLGAGGMGEVYRAHDPRLGRDIAIKVLPSEVGGDPERLRRFEQEARAVAALNHPNIVTIHSVEQAAGFHFLTMELVDGQSLTDLIPRGGLTVDRLLDVAVPLADAVGAAHARGVIHRDLKPSNVMVTFDGRLKVLDFGLAKLSPLTGASASTARTVSDMTAGRPMLGTAAYMSPEQAEGRTVDHRSDLFSLGVLLFEAATGQRPFKGDSSLSQLSSLLKDTPPALVELRPDLPRELGRIVRRCLEKDLDRRYQSAIDLRNDLQELRQERAVAGLAPPKAVGSSWFTRRSVRWIAGSAGAIAAVVLLYVAWRSPLRSLSLQPAAPHPVAARVQFSIPVPDSVRYLEALSTSPDSSRISFVGAGRLWIHDLATGVTRDVGGIVGASPQHPFWSPDGNFIAYFQGPTGKLRKVPVAGGLPQDIADVSGPLGGSWGSDNTIIFAALAQDEGVKTRTAIYRVSADGGVPVQITRPDASKGEVAHRWPRFLPDGHHFTYLSAGMPSILYLASTDAQEPRRAVTTVRDEGYAVSDFLLTAERGTLRAQPLASDDVVTTGDAVTVAHDVGLYGPPPARYAFSASAGVLAYWVEEPRRFQFWVVDRTGQPRRAVGPPIPSRYGPGGGWSLSPNGEKIAFSQHDTRDQQRTRIWEMDLARGVPTPFSPGVGSDALPLWTPSGDDVVYSSSDRPDGAGLYLKRSASDSETLIVASRLGLILPFDWHPDGLLLFGMRGPSSAFNMWLVTRTPGEKPRLWHESDHDEFGATFSPDGRWVAYESEESGVEEIYVRRFPGADGMQKISPVGGDEPVWRRDGKALFYLQDDMLMEAELDTTTMSRAGVPRPLFKVGPQESYAPLPNGQHFVLFGPIDAVPRPTITAVLNWTAGLRSK